MIASIPRKTKAGEQEGDSMKNEEYSKEEHPPTEHARFFHGDGFGHFNQRG